MKRKIIIGLCSLFLSVDIYAKGGGGGSWGKITTHNKFGDKKFVKNSKAKSSSFNQSDICKKYIYIDTYSSFRTKDYIPYWWGSFESGYATTKVTLGNDSYSCKRIPFIVPYLHIRQVGTAGSIKNSRNPKDGKAYNKSYLRSHMVSGGLHADYETIHTVHFKDKTIEKITVYPEI